MSGETETPKAAKRWKRILGKVFRIFMITVLLILLMGFIGVTVPVEIAFHLIAGPFIHAWKNLPPFLVQWRSALLPLACLAIGVMLAHRFILWWIKTKVIRISWRIRHTVSAASLLLLGSAAAITMSGITHQAAWLSSSPWLQSNHRPYQTMAVNNARMTMLALLEYEADHEKYPDTLEEAVNFAELPLRVLMVQTGAGKPSQPFNFLKPGQASTGKLEPVLVSPVIETDRVVVGYSNNSVRTMTLKEWQTMRQEIQTAHE